MTRPTEYNEEMAKRICDLVATHTDGLRKLTKLYPELPDVMTIYRWRHQQATFRDQYAEAKRFQAELLAEEVQEIADDGTNDYIEDSEGNERLNSEHVQRSRLRIDTRKWIACKLLPKVYGDKQQNDVGMSESLMQKVIDKL